MATFGVYDLQSPMMVKLMGLKLLQLASNTVVKRKSESLDIFWTHRAGPVQAVFTNCRNVAWPPRTRANATFPAWMHIFEPGNSFPL